MTFLLYLGAACLFVSGLLTGAWTTGMQQRANFHTESSSYRRHKQMAAAWLALASLLAFAAAGTIYAAS